MWPFKKKEPPGAEEVTLKNNVSAFWHWFASNSERFYDTIENKACSDLTDEVSDAFDRWLPGMAWVFGPGANRVGHSLTISGEGVQMRQFVARFCVEQAPSLPNWTFYDSRQSADKAANFSIEIGGESFKVSDLWVATYLDEQDEKIDIEAWHPLFAKMEEREPLRVLFLLLDEILGEFGTGNWIGEIKIGDGRLKEAMPIWELHDYTEKLKLEKGWSKYSPTETFGNWNTEAKSGYPRADAFTGATRCFSLIADFGRSRGPIENPLEGLGVDLAYVRLDRSWLPKGKEIDHRCEVEELIATRLEAAAAGWTLGGATGLDWSYIDLMLFDGQRSLEMVKQALRTRGLPKDTEIRWFTSDKADKVVLI